MRDREPDAFGSLRFTPPREPLRAASWVTDRTDLHRRHACGPHRRRLPARQPDHGRPEQHPEPGPGRRRLRHGAILERDGGARACGQAPRRAPRWVQGDQGHAGVPRRAGNARARRHRDLHLRRSIGRLEGAPAADAEHRQPAAPDLRRRRRQGTLRRHRVAGAGGVGNGGGGRDRRAGAVGGGDRRAVRRRGAHRGPVRQSVERPAHPATSSRSTARWWRGSRAATMRVAVAKGLRLTKAGTYRFAARSSDGKLEAISNPVWVEARPDRRVYWGELHGHSGYAEGQGAADQYFRYAREDARLDFVSLTDHDTAMDDWEWRTIDEARRRYDKDGEFVAFLGYEWSAGRELGGHHNVFFRKDGAKRVPRQEAPVLDALYPRLARENGADNVLVIPHAHTAADWNQSDGDVERLVEIASHARHLRVVRQPLPAERLRARVHRRIRRPSLEAGTRARPVLLAAGPARRPGRGDRAGEDRRRHLRRAAGALGVRHLGRPHPARRAPQRQRMGTRQASNARRTIEGRVSGTAPIDRVDVVKNGEVAWSESYLAAPLESHAWVEVGFESSSEVFPPPVDNPREYRVWSGTLDVEGARVVGLKTTGPQERLHRVGEDRSRAAQPHPLLHRDPRQGGDDPGRARGRQRRHALRVRPGRRQGERLRAGRAAAGADPGGQRRAVAGRPRRLTARARAAGRPARGPAEAPGGRRRRRARSRFRLHRPRRGARR